MLVYASCTTNSSVHESVISCTSPFSSSSKDGSSEGGSVSSSDIIEKCRKNIKPTTINKNKLQVQQQQLHHNNNQRLKNKLQGMPSSSKTPKKTQNNNNRPVNDEGYNSEETNRNSNRSIATNSRPTSRESSNSAPDINRSDKRYNSLRQAQKQAIEQVQQKLKKSSKNNNYHYNQHHYENHSVLKNIQNAQNPSNQNSSSHYQNIKANVQLSVIHQNINSTVYKTTYNKHDCILKKIANTDSAQYSTASMREHLLQQLARNRDRNYSGAEVITQCEEVVSTSEFGSREVKF